MQSRIRLLAIDLDGTLLDSQFQLSSANRDAVAAAHSLGTQVVLVTGRRFTSARGVARQLPIELTVVASNGAVVKQRDGTTLYRQLLPRSQARAVLAAASGARDSALLMFARGEHEILVAENALSHHPPVQRYLERNRSDLTFRRPLEDALTEDPIEVLFIGAVAPLRTLAERLHSSPVAPRVSLVKTEYPLRDLTLLDVLDQGCTKGAAVARLAAERGLDRQEVMAIGDNWSDRELLEFAGLPVLMGNSTDELKKEGWPVTATNNQDGVALAIRRFLLSGC